MCKSPQEWQVFKGLKYIGVIIFYLKAQTILGPRTVFTCGTRVPKGNLSNRNRMKAKNVRASNYSWIGHGLQSGLTLAFSPWLSDFKTKTSFGFLSPNCTGHVFWIFLKNRKMSSFGQFWRFWRKFYGSPIIATR